MTNSRSNGLTPSVRGTRAGQAGFALVLALLALMLLTFLGLTLAATTSTELQIATNYRWSQQALVNAEAGVEAGKILLRTMNWATILPAARTLAAADQGLWTGATGQSAIAVVAPFSRADAWANASRNFENAGCDTRGAGVGYGVVLDDGSATAPYQYKTTVLGHNLNGAFTLWVRRPVIVEKDGNLEDYSLNNDNLVLVSEGTAPYSGNSLATTFASANRATQVIEVTLSRTPLAAASSCEGRQGQTGGGPEGGNFGGCNTTIDATAVGTATGLAGVTEIAGVQ